MTRRLFRWAAPLALLLVAFLSYGIFAFQQGFHWDDWGFAWLIRTLGRPGLFDYFATNRPFLAYVYSGNHFNIWYQSNCLAYVFADSCAG